jgi:hypothetical protein
MKIKSNVRAGSGGNGGGNSKAASSSKTSKNSHSLSNVVISYVPQLNRCLGI